jgi:hypothetical protein
MHSDETLNMTEHQAKEGIAKLSRSLGNIDDRARKENRALTAKTTRPEGPPRRWRISRWLIFRCAPSPAGIPRTRTRIAQDPPGRLDHPAKGLLFLRHLRRVVRGSRLHGVVRGRPLVLVVR